MASGEVGWRTSEALPSTRVQKIARARVGRLADEPRD